MKFFWYESKNNLTLWFRTRVFFVLSKRPQPVCIYECSFKISFLRITFTVKLFITDNVIKVCIRNNETISQQHGILDLYSLSCGTQLSIFLKNSTSLLDHYCDNWLIDQKPPWGVDDYNFYWWKNIIIYNKNLN